MSLRLLVAKKKAVADGEIVQGDSLSKDARLEVLSGVLSQIERSYGKGTICFESFFLSAIVLQPVSQ
jgi:hypothetical protein